MVRTSEDLIAKRLAETRNDLCKRLEDGVKLRGNKAGRKDLYKKWRAEIGDNAARESARYVEALLDGKVGWPKWYKRNS